MSTAGLPPRHRLRVLFGLPLVVGAGLATRAGLPLPTVVGVYGGDTLYAVLIFLLWALLLPGASSGRLAGAAWLVCLCIELSQLVEGGWLSALRATRLGALVLGRGFLWSDLACYAVGAGLAALADRALRQLRAHRSFDLRSGSR